MKLTLPTDSAVRKGVPLYSGCYSYFPAALAGVAMHSKAGNDKHNPGEALHHSRGKSGDHPDCIARHSMDLADMMARRAVYTEEQKRAILTESRALSWRALAWGQEIEEMFGAPLAPGARLPVTKPDPRVYNAIADQRPEWTLEPSFLDVLETKPNPEINRAIDRLCELEPPKECSGSSGSECSQPQSGRTLAQGHALSRGLARDPIYDAPAIFDAPDPA